MATGGLNVWGESGNRIRQFTLAIADEDEAFKILTAAFPDLKVLSRHKVDAALIQMLKLPNGKGCEWVPIDPRDKLNHIGGVRIGQPLN